MISFDVRGRFLTAVVAVVAASVALAACTPSDAAPDASPEGEAFTVAYVPGVTQNSYFDTVKRGMEKIAADNNITIIHQGSPNFDPVEQTAVLNAVLAQAPDLLIVAPSDPVSMRAPIERFINADIPVITVDQVLENSEGIVSSIYGDSRQGGELAGAEMAEQIDGSGTVAIINVVSGVTVLDERVEGFIDALADAAPDVTIAPVQEAGSSPSGSEAVTRSLLLAYPDLKGIYGVTEVNAEGAAAALRAQNRSGDIPVIAYDGTPLEVEYLEDGLLQYLIVQQAAKTGELAMQYAVDYLSGDTSSIEKLVTLPTVGVGADDLDDPAVQAVLYGPAIS
ncbi:substrate-binding domain-containing protein [Microbacterium trichothecenolyticum]|uniref:Substrate-binding domain-containing protein n=1 Tax=Microbacterium ureisolvens TaxID=2781186 RepID=A0ABS7HZE6_9MICO|nr:MULTISPECIES: substrate-binding domain-containing protein [Microbacterium]MBW9110448.1 substrate-binding domain-containing protein [Microbacterium ureisolvens]MBW9120553.1 substrate-binding domain-containing protein [Microbacterium trichothecenolyticum]